MPDFNLPLDWKTELNERQWEAVTAEAGPLLVLAGAGSGKTKVLTYRIAHLIASQKVAREHILAVTFTNKAAEEMRARIQRLLSKHVRRNDLVTPSQPPETRVENPAFIGTFHALGVRILREAGAKVGVPPHFVIYDSEDQLTLLRAIEKELAIDTRELPPSTVREYIARAKVRLFSPEAMQDEAHTSIEKLMSRCYEEYMRRLRKLAAVDFDDLLNFTVKVLTEFPDIRDRFQTRFQFIAVDEYQDTNEAQYRMVRLLSEVNRSITVVGDDAQSIYGFRGANIQNILSFERDYPDAKVIFLNQNYRSTKAILKVASHVIRGHAHAKRSALFTENHEGERVKLYRASEEKEEAYFVARTIYELIQKERRTFHDVVILYRMHAQSRELEEMCIREKIPYEIFGGVSFYERREIKDILAYFRMLANPSDLISFSRILRFMGDGIGEKSTAVLSQYLRTNERPVWEFTSVAMKELNLSARAHASLGRLSDLFARLKNTLASHDLTRLFDAIMASGYEKMLTHEGEEGEIRLENLRALRGLMSDYEGGDGETMLTQFLAHATLMGSESISGSRSEAVRDRTPRVRFMTLHAAKGLEFPVVFIVGLNEGILPHARSLDRTSELNEERRLFYVGITRAKERLYLTLAGNRRLFGSYTITAPSRFLNDIEPEALEPIDSLFEFSEFLPRIEL
ncbi:MAG: UvrD-helicase domain-containing protein [Parcubacteria group bacterium]|nr:UvrD-helicase domain-containing protein [Parcubacteria group bacterium]